MPVCKDRYRGTVQYALVYRELVTAAEYRGTVTYKEIAAIMGLPLWGSHMGREVGWILGEISEDEVHRGRPMLSAIAVNKDGESSDGFFNLARELGRLDATIPEAEVKFWLAEQKAVYKTWQRQFHSQTGPGKAT
jgi:alkylated DNA nucleotide flippase Atl1